VEIEKYSFGTGDRFGKEGRAQLEAIQGISRQGFKIAPVWNKSNREHSIIGSAPGDVKAEAAAVVAANRYTGNYYIDACHDMPN
jgi:hypothetical protein